MVETAPLWSVLVLPVVVVGFALAAAAADALLVARAQGRTLSVAIAADPLRESARLLVGQRRTTAAPDSLLWRLGLLSVPAAAVLAALVIPLGDWSVDDLPGGIVWFNAMEVLLWVGLWMAGWGANSAHSLVGGYRFVAQGMAYELPHMFVLITAALGAQSLRVGDIVAAQSGLWFVLWMPVAFVVYLASALPMSFFEPFDAPVGTDVAGGVGAEVSGVDRLIFFGGRWLMLVVSGAFAVPLFLGGGHGPLLPAWLWTFAKTARVLALLVWVRRRLPTVRMERWMEISWMVLVPLTIAQALVVALVVLNR